MADKDLPSVSDPIWGRWSLPLFEFLQEARVWVDLEAWTKRNSITGNVLRNQLAWLEQNGLASERRGSWKATRSSYLIGVGNV